MALSLSQSVSATPWSRVLAGARRVILLQYAYQRSRSGGVKKSSKTPSVVSCLRVATPCRVDFCAAVMTSHMSFLHEVLMSHDLLRRRDFQDGSVSGVSFFSLTIPGEWPFRDANKTVCGTVLPQTKPVPSSIVSIMGLCLRTLDASAAILSAISLGGVS
ncbi:hypothetical protein AUEXF2481DRAFT_496024 [Aureobasidium subglaciale EXF-2481]|uniref:Uncharacterized protein n=1 Tax=Aureobasidium subglaciale (strain EXF-2481) TaxID=1043005 RepID=A0A074YLK4_AURSE|nr:uncharacterized protein AUEXF2481DRAFT_496024 [Aureobasidium subglaciale EXF-2481]KEQ98575.1 hypothetical protein AUEXF2481DRAFT_496024 [Aureobasidium subglaciale EXF-2481]